MSDDDCGLIMNRSAASIRDMWVKLQDQIQKRYGLPFTKEEDIALIKGMKNNVFLFKYERGQKETNQRRFDLLRPKGRFLYLHPEVRPNYKPVVNIKTANIHQMEYGNIKFKLTPIHISSDKELHRFKILDRMIQKTGHICTPYQCAIIGEIFKADNKSNNKIGDLKELTLILAEILMEF